MFYVLQNESTAALRRVPILLTDAATGTTAQTGIAATNIYPYVNINGGAFAGGAGTVAEAGYGQYYYEFDPTEVVTLGLAGIHVTAVGCRDYDAICQVAALNVYSAGSGLTAGDVWNYTLLSTADTADLTLGTAKQQADNAANNTGTSQIRSNVWDFDIDSAGFNTSPPFAAGYLINAGNGATTAGSQVWNYDISAVSGAGLAGTQLNIAASGGAGITAGDVWDFSITGFGGTNSAAVYVTNTNFTAGNIETYVSTQTPTDIWSYAGIEGRTITGGLANTVTSVTNPVSITTADMTGIAGTVWNSLTASYTTNDTFGKTILRSDAGNKSGDVTLRSAGGINMVDADIHRIDNDVDAATNLKNALTGIGASWTGNITGNLTGSVNSVTSDVNVSTASMSGIANTVWSYGTRTLTSGGGITAGDVWSYATRDITGGTVDTVTNNVDISAGSVNDIWQEDISGYTSPSAGFDLSQAAAGSGLTAGDVWSYVTRTLTSGGAGITAGDVWSYAGGRTITGGIVTSVGDKTGYSLSGTQSFNLTGNITGNLSGSVGSVTNPVDITTNAMSGTAGSVWSYVTRTLTSGGGVTAGDVWSYGTRTITGGIADTVTTVTNGVTVSTNNDKTGYALSTAGVNAVQSGLSTLTQAQVGTEVDSSLADVGLTTTVTGRIDAAVSSRLASASYTAPPTTAAIAGTVWTYSPRTLTSGAGATAGDIWNYNIAAITNSGTAGAQLNDAAVSGSVVTIVNGPYKLTSIAEGTDGRIDILADSVQTIQLNCLDGFGQPFNVTGYTAVVNVYDVSGALTVTYTPTVDFASSGIVSFDIDTDVTGVTGRYTLVVELTAGAEVVQLGPLEILVRPL